MAKTLSPVCKLCRREGEKLYLKGERCFSPKCAFEKRSFPPGQHGKTAGHGRGAARRVGNQTFRVSCAQNRKLAASMVCWNANSTVIMRRLCIAGA